MLIVSSILHAASTATRAAAIVVVSWSFFHLFSLEQRPIAKAEPLVESIHDRAKNVPRSGFT